MSILSVFKKQDAAKAVSEKGKGKKVVEKKKAEKAVEKLDASAIASFVKSPIVRPIITEKATLLNSEGKYAFQVVAGTSKQDVRSAVEKQFKVHVESVNIVKVPSKVRMRGAIVGHVSGYRKAYVSLRDGETIDLTK